MILKGKQRTGVIKISLLLLQVMLCVFFSAGSSFANVADPGKEDTKLCATSNPSDGQLLFASGPGVPVAPSFAKPNNFSGPGLYNKDIIYPGHSLTHSEKSFFKYAHKNFSFSKNPAMRLHLACCVLLI